MSSIALGMYDEVIRGLVSDDRSNLKTMSKRDVEVNRQYFCLVRLLRSSLVDKRLASAFNLENVDVLDYRVAASLLERAGDSIVLLSELVLGSSCPGITARRFMMRCANLSSWARSRSRPLPHLTGFWQSRPYRFTRALRTI